MAKNLHQKQTGDDYCEASLDKSEDKKKALENSITDSEVAMAEIKGTIDKRTDEIAQLEATVKSLDKAVAEATELRQADHKQLMSDDSNAKELLSFAKNRLNRF